MGVCSPENHLFQMAILSIHGVMAAQDSHSYFEATLAGWVGVAEGLGMKIFKPPLKKR